MCLRRAPEKYIVGAKAPAGAALDRAGLDRRLADGEKLARRSLLRRNIIFYVSGTELIPGPSAARRIR
jgi:hypothetical protein